MSADYLIINELSVDAVIGVYEWEKKIKQKLVLDLELYLPEGSVKQAANSDDLKDALDYTALTESIQNLINSRPVQLIETLAEQIAQLLLAEFSLEKVKICLKKPAALAQASTVGIVIERCRLSS